MVRNKIAATERIEKVAFEEAADAADLSLAQARLEDRIVSGPDLEERLRRLELAD